MSSAAAAKRESEFADATDAYHSSISATEKHHASLRAAITVAWNDREVVATFVGIGRLALAHFSSKPSQPVYRSAGQDEIVWASGNEGERSVSTYFAGHLPDDWTLVSGYRNSKGEIDQVLIGSRGVFAIEIKFINGVIHCDGDRWWRDKYDRYGNLVESNLPIQDRRGRGPSRQLNESADMLQSFLVKRIGLSRVRRAVLLSHKSSKLGEMKNITVDLVATLDSLDIDSLFGSSSATLDSASIERVIQAIRKDHDFHDKH